MILPGTSQHRRRCRHRAAKPATSDLTLPENSPKARVRPTCGQPRAGDIRNKPPRMRSGATLVEFAIVANLLFLLIFGCMEMARLNMARNLAQDAAYYAARVAMVPGATEAEAEAEADRLMGSLFEGGYEVACSPLNDQAEEITVTVTVIFDDLAFFLPMFMGGVTFDSAVTMKTERYNGFFEADSS